MKYQIEICANSVQSAINAEIGGANRVELCDNLWEGGTTPSYASIALAKERIEIPIFVLVRPRGGDFVYDDLEFETIKRDIVHAKSLGVAGIVSGVLLPDGQVDVVRTSELVKLSDPLPFTFHRAFDQTPDMLYALEELVKCGVKRILTSGQRRSAIEGLDQLKLLLKHASGRITILPGGGISKKNVKEIQSVGCKEFHLSAKTHVSGLSTQKSVVPMNGSKDIPERTIQVSSPEKIKEIKTILDELI